MSELVVRRAQVGDRDQVLPLARELATSYAADAAAYAAVFDQVVSDPNALLLVADDGDRIVGYLLAQRHHTFHANGPVVWVEEVLVTADQRGQGVGRALMEAAEAWGRSRGAAYVALATRRAVDFYRALGYEESASYLKRAL